MIPNPDEALWLRTYGVKLRQDGGRTYLELGAIAVVVATMPKTSYFDDPRSSLSATDGSGRSFTFFQNSIAEQTAFVRYLGKPYEVRGSGEVDVTDLKFTGRPQFLPILPRFAKDALLRAASQNPIQPRIKRSRLPAVSVIMKGYEKSKSDLEYDAQEQERIEAERRYHEGIDKAL